MNNTRNIRPTSLLAMGPILIAFSCATVSNAPVTNGAVSDTGGSSSTAVGGTSGAVGGSGNGGNTSSVGGKTGTGGVPSTGGAQNATGLGGTANTGIGGVPSTGGTQNATGQGGTANTGGSSHTVVTGIPLPYTDDFEDGSTAAWLPWNSSSSALGSWAIAVDGTTTNHVLQQSNSGSSATWFVGGDVNWKDQILSVKARWADTSTYIYASVRFNNTDGYYYLQAVPGSKPKIRVRNSGSTTDVCAGTTNFAGTVGTWYTISVTAQGSTISAAIDGAAVCSATNTAIANGGIAVGTDGGQAAFDDVNVTSP